METPRVAQCLSEKLVAARQRSGALPETDAETTALNQILLAAGFSMGLNPLYYARINKPAGRGRVRCRERLGGFLRYYCRAA